MTSNPADYERVPSLFHRVLEIACAVVGMLLTAGMCVGLVMFASSTTVEIVVTTAFGALFGVSCWLFCRFVFTPAQALSPRGARKLAAFSGVCALLGAAIKLVA